MKTRSTGDLKMKDYKWFYIGLGALLTLLIGGAVFSTANVSADSEFNSAFGISLDDGTDIEHDRGPRDGHRGRRGNRGQGAEFLAAELGITEDELTAAKEAVRDAATEDSTREELAALFAAELGLTVEELEAAKDAAKDAALAEALANGDITQEQIDLYEAKKAFNAVFDKKAAAAAALGLTVEELEAAKDAGTSKSELLEEAGLTKEEARAAMAEAKADALSEAVANGDITAEQAELIENAPEGRRGGKHGGRGKGQRNRGNGVTAPEAQDA